ncbi:MAG: DegT/DnrJ/EryC1/StrS family aminotransferase [Acidobacteria bacterium]|nr:DegT/DnrJ/EryC1/StrS family aminotransferase [Acidobacteriota bacterium]
MRPQPDVPYYEYQEKLQSEKVPYYESWLGEEELRQVTEVIRANWISEGAKTRAFEDRLAALHQRKYALAVVNCTAALIMGLKAMGIGQGDEVIAPTFTFIASVNAIRLAGATPVLVDVDPKTFTLDLGAAERAVTPRTKAIMPVHLYGHPADLDGVLAVARRHNLRVIEDTAQGLGVKYRGRPVGSFGELACLSFFADKAITLGEGGLVMTNSDELFRELLMLKNDGRLERGIYFHDRVGYNFRITDLQAAVGLAQLDKLPRIIEGKRRNRELYRKYLEGVEGIEFTYEASDCTVVPHRVNVFVDDPEALARHLGGQGIGCRRFYVPVHKQPCYRLPGSFPVAERLYARGLSLPSAPTLAEGQIALVAGKVKAYLRSLRQATV